jgi:hypothetical protein
MSCSSVGLEHRSYAPGVTGSSPVSTIPFFWGLCSRFPFLFLFFFFFGFHVHLSLYYICGLAGPLGSSSVTLFKLVPITAVLYYYYYCYYYAKCAIWRGARAFAAISARLRMTPFFFSHLASLFSLVALSPSGSFLRICARVRRHRGPPQKRRSIVALSRL